MSKRECTLHLPLHELPSLLLAQLQKEGPHMGLASACLRVCAEGRQKLPSSGLLCCSLPAAVLDGLWDPAMHIDKGAPSGSGWLALSDAPNVAQQVIQHSQEAHIISA